MKKEKFGNVGVGKKSILDGLKELDKNEVSTVPLVEERLQRDEQSQNSKKLYIYKWLVGDKKSSAVWLQAFKLGWMAE